MATTLRCQVSIVNDSTLPRDLAVNTWHFSSASVDPVDDATAAQLELWDFYAAIQAVYSSSISGDLFSKWYDLSDANPRTPILEATTTIVPDSSPRLPNECAVCLSYRGVLTSGTNPKRRRGRIFLGPLTSDVVTAGTGDAFVTSAAMTTIATAADSLNSAGDPGTWNWAVFSPTTAGPEPWSAGELLSATLPVVAGYVDNAFDTIRSRGLAATDRETF